MKRIMHQLGNLLNYVFTRLFILLVSLMPFRVLYIFSDLVFLLLYYIIRYRRNVVRQNLSGSFPQKQPADITRLEKEFYHHLCDITLESLKGFTMTKNQVLNRHKILNPELADAFFEKGKSVIGTPAHFNNWEWGSLSPGLQIKSPVFALYKPLSNQFTDRYVRKNRARFKTTLVSTRQTAITFSKMADRPVTYIMAADQSPSNLRECYWIDFMNHETACIHGPEKYARLYDIPVLYVDIRKVKRGFYELTLIPLTDHPRETADGEITRKYMEMLERSIKGQPAFWLWSHKRWKHSRAV